MDDDPSLEELTKEIEEVDKLLKEKTKRGKISNILYCSEEAYEAITKAGLKAKNEKVST